MEIHFEIREKGQHHRILIMQGTIDDWCGGDKRFKKMIEEKYPLETHIHNFWTEKLETVPFKF